MSILEPFLVYPTVNLTKGVTAMMGCVKYLGLAMMLCLVQCKADKKPKGLLSKEEMVNMMVEVYLAEAKASLTGVPRDSAAKLFETYEGSMISADGFNDSTLKANYNYYLQRPEELERILDAVIDSLSLREQRASDQP